MNVPAANGRPLLIAMGTATLLIAQQVAGKATRDALFLSHLNIKSLPEAVTSAAVVSLLTVLLLSWLLTRRAPVDLVPRVFVISALLFIVEWLWFEFAPKRAILMMYLHIAALGAVLISGFWLVVNERFDPHTAKHHIARIAAAATLGGAIGGVITDWVSTEFALQNMFLLLAAMQILCALGTRQIGGQRRSAGLSTPTPLARQSVREGASIIVRHSYLRAMVWLMLSTAVVAALLDFALKSEAARYMTDSASLAAFFARYYGVVSILTFLVQASIAPPLLRRFGIGVALAMLPLMVMLGGVYALATAAFSAFVVLRALENITVHSLYRSGFELLYVPLSANEKRPTKALIDVGGSRLGDLLGGVLLLLLVPRLLEASSIWVTAVALLFAVLTVWLVYRLYQNYVERLGSNLRAGGSDLQDEGWNDATTRRVFAETSAQAEREQLLTRILHLEQAQDPLAGGQTQAAGQLAVYADLLSGDPARIRQTLKSHALHVGFTAQLIPLLAHSALAEDVRLELRWFAPRIIGQLADALADPDLDARARRRLPSVLEVVHSQRVVDILLSGLQDQDFGVRYSCARALKRMTSRSQELHISSEGVFDLVRAELSRNGTALSHPLAEEEGLPPEILPGAAVVEAGKISLRLKLRLIFTLLSLTLDHQALPQAERALLSTDAIARGTALEYLENVLPSDVRSELWQLIGVQGLAADGGGKQ